MLSTRDLLHISEITHLIETEIELGRLSYAHILSNELYCELESHYRSSQNKAEKAFLVGKMDELLDKDQIMIQRGLNTLLE